MQTKVIKIDRNNIDTKDIAYCADVIRNGGLVCFPTETVYGLGASAFNSEAVKNIYKAKGRPADNPLIVHISDYKMLELVTDCDGEQRNVLNKLAEAFWPGPLTLISHRDDAVPAEVSCGLDTVGIRFPSHPIARALIEAAGVPIAAPSANLSGKPSPTRAEHVIEDMMGRVDVIIDGGNCDVGVESTVFDIAGTKMSVLRPGAVTLEQLLSVVNTADELDWMKPHMDSDEKPRSPGLKYRHYAPNATVNIYDGVRPNLSNYIIEEIKNAKRQGFSVGVLATDESICYYKEVDGVVLSLGSLEDSLQQASNLFHCLRRFDDMGVDMVFAEAVPKGGAGDAVMNRLYRAAGGKIVTVETARDSEGHIC